MRLQGGKHTRLLLMATDGYPNAHSRLFVTDRLTKMQFLVDTGSGLCVFPHSAVQQRCIRTTYHHPRPSCILTTTSLGARQLQIAKCELETMLKNGTADLPKAAGRHLFTSHRTRNQDGDPVATIG
ncbi:hypothetical protein EVAR_59361_1 [Eumeta japonica]|uniref:Peptidase A2 domain-containing protein n=1 Tax=Eumeta variegata TaxID=151549 RepID=A0A4C1SQ63_EUMVA|nr:hypothetical protein EVAR_59361_1 [Eumeta japonica]